MSSCNIPDRLKIFNVSNWQPEANKPARYSHGELGYFSIDEERHFLPNKSKLGTLNLPQDCKNIDIDLNAGFEQWKDLPNVQQHLDSMLQWILLNKELLTMAGNFRSNDGVRYTLDNLKFVRHTRFVNRVSQATCRATMLQALLSVLPPVLQVAATYVARMLPQLAAPGGVLPSAI